MTERARFLPASLLALATFAVALPSAAQDQHAAAQVLFEKGKALVESGKFAEACPALAESLKLDPGLGTMLWLADCYENNGQTASAWAQFKDATAKAALLRDAREKVASDRAANLEKRLSRLQVVVSTAARTSDLEIKRDGVVIGNAELGLAVPVDPGTHTIAAAAPGRKPWSTTVTIATTPGTTPVPIPVLEPQEGETTPGPGGETPAESSPGSTQRVLGLVVGGVGLAAIGVGAYFSLDAKSTYDDSNANGHCADNRCDATGLSLRDDAKSQALVATIAMGAGAAALATGAILFFTAPKRQPVAISPAIGPRGAGLGVAGSF
jgi:hypothetical protein